MPARSRPGTCKRRAVAARRGSVSRWGLLLVTLLLTGHAAAMNPGDAPQTAPPNILLVVSDDQGWTDYGFMGHPHIQTPNLDAIARQGVLFRRGYVPTALCRPSLMTLATGRYAHEHGVTGNDPSARGLGADPQAYQALQARLINKIQRFDTLPELLAAAGYTSFQSGKWWESSFDNGGFSEGMTRGYPATGARHGDDGLVIGRETVAPITRFIDRAVAREQPFFVWYAPYLPHFPHDPPAQLLEKYLQRGLPTNLARYYAMCEWLDQTIGQLLEHLESAGVRDNTLVVFIADNGWIQSTDHPGFAARSKLTAYDAGTRSPILFSLPGGLPAADRPELVSSIDLLPTLLGAAGAAIPPGLPGLNLWPAISQGNPLERDTIFGEGFAHDIADLDNPAASLLYRWCIEGRWKLILNYPGMQRRFTVKRGPDEQQSQLFDLLADPHERENLAARHPEIVERLREKIERWYPLQLQPL